MFPLNHYKFDLKLNYLIISIKKMFKILGLMSLSTQSLSQPVNGDILPVYDYHSIGGANDANGCLVSAGYSWCEANSECIRSWITPCEDNYDDCSDCFTKQSQGINIACPIKCNSFGQVINPFLPIPPPPPPTMLQNTVQLLNDQMMPLISDPPMPPHPVDPLPCPEVMCMMYCENGFQQDDAGCPTCNCDDNMPILNDHAPDKCSMVQTAIMNECNSHCHTCDISTTLIVLNQCVTKDGIQSSENLCDPSQIDTCPIPYTTCNNNYVCPKVTEITQCSQGGMSGFTTYQLSLIIINPAVQNIYAIYGDDQPVEHPMDIPPAYQGSSIFNSNLGGIDPGIIAINHDATYDSWLTIGLTDGDPRNKLSVVGIDFDSWTETVGIHTTNGAVFVMDPQEVIVQGDEYVVAQLTIPNDESTDVVINAQGELNCDKCRHAQTWQEKQIVFHLERPQVVNPNVIPDRCLSWFDGCNTCRVSNGNLRECTRMMCFREDNPHCLSFDITGH
jgi:hypothetical protein